MKFVLQIELGNDAMMTRLDIARTLQKLATKLYASVGEAMEGDGGALYDDNGNCVGGWHVEK